MPDASVMMYIAAEIAGFLLLICIFLLLHIKKLRGLISKLEGKIVSLRKSLSKSRKETKKVKKELEKKSKNKPKAFLEYLDEEIDLTREYHEDLKPDRDIVLDIAPDSPIERQATSLRHAFLIAEKEARYAGNEETSDWSVLQAKHQQIIDFYMGAAPSQSDDMEPVEVDNADEVETLKKRIANLEGFKKLFFEMEGQWETAKAQAEEYYQQLKAMGKGLGAGEDYDDLLDRYSKTFDDLGGLIASGGDVSDGSASNVSTVIEIDNRQKSVGQKVIRNQEEIHRLKNMAVDQHKIIEELKKKLVGAGSEEETQQVITELTQELEQLQRFVKEAETCTQLIEDELSRAMQENDELRERLGGVNDAEGTENTLTDEETERLESMMKDLTSESQDMLATIASLEDENQALKKQLDKDVSGGDSGDLQKKLDDVQQELLNLQTQHIELEERYLELKMKG